MAGATMNGSPPRPLRESLGPRDTNAQNLPNSPTDAHFDGANVISKYRMAMRNPDWRRKGGGSAANNSESTNTDQFSVESAPVPQKPDYIEHIRRERAAGPPAIREHYGTMALPTAYSTQNISHSAPKTIYETAHLPQYANVQRHKGEKDEEIQLLYELVSYKALSNPGGRPLGLMEVRYPENDDLKNDHARLVELRAVPSESNKRIWHLQGDSADAQSEQFHAALRGVENTPYQVRRTKRPAIIPHVTFTDPASEKQSLHSAMFSDITARTRGGTDSSFGGWGELSSGPPSLHTYMHHHPEVLRRGDRSTLDLRSSCSDEPRSEEVENRTAMDARYAKMLEKLHNGGSKQNPSTFREPVSPTGQSQLAQRRDARNGASDDSGYMSMRQNHTQLQSSASESVGQTAKDSENLNPKAREFLSFRLEMEQKKKKEQEESLRGFRPVPVQELFVKENEARGAPVEKAPDPVNFIDPGAALLAPQHLYDAPWAQHSPCTTNFPKLAMAEHNDPFNNMINPGPAFNPPLYPLPNYNATWGPGQMAPNFATSAQPDGMSWLAGLSSSMINPFQPTNKVATDFIAPALHTMNPMAPTFPNPAPVPKPRRPDPSDQQAYEAYIEWRKANEPGYAAQCKLRQQRRSQRNAAKVRITRPPQDPPAPKSSPVTIEGKPKDESPARTSA